MVSGNWNWTLRVASIAHSTHLLADSFLQLPFGIKSAPENFHRPMESIIEGLEGTCVYIDDLIVWGSTLAQHNERLLNLLKRIQLSGLKLNESKCQFGATEITFLGDKLSGEGSRARLLQSTGYSWHACPYGQEGGTASYGNGELFRGSLFQIYPHKQCKVRVWFCLCSLFRSLNDFHSFLCLTICLWIERAWCSVLEPILLCKHLKLLAAVLRPLSLWTIWGMPCLPKILFMRVITALADALFSCATSG